MSKLLWPNGKKTPGSVWHEYGPRKPIWTPAGWTTSFHGGIDIGPWEGTYDTPLRSPVSGRVIHAGFDIIYGNRVVVREDLTGDDFWLCHMRTGSMVVKAGDRVAPAQKVGVMGETGKASGVHIHYEVWHNGARVNPRTYYANRYAAPAGGGGTAFVPAPDEDPYLSEEDNMITVIKRDGKDEWTLINLDVGLDLHRLTGTPLLGKTYRTSKTKGGVVNTYRGFMVTTDPDIGNAWSRTYCRPYGHAPQIRKEGDYQIAQLEASRLSAEVHSTR